MDKEYIRIYHDYLDAINLLSDSERGRLFVALLEYGSTGAEQELTGNEKYLFAIMRTQIDKDREKELE